MKATLIYIAERILFVFWAIGAAVAAIILQLLNAVSGLFHAIKKVFKISTDPELRKKREHDEYYKHYL